ncbi:ABC transporter substrate-binding protein [Humitalea sp. 24SJ18S-53]|uniref:ABC transporter substrate-binding protein n=1 Tax=Humitalea sp. 24SJ18S-53 TaxID=3422307 RepID=UPI003D66A1F9
MMWKTLAFRACVLAGLVPGAVAAQSLTIALQTDLTALDPHVAPTFTSAGMQQHVYGSLVAMDVRLNIVPDLATAWRNIDETTWEFDLREGVRFSDGTPFTADDVVFSLRRAATIRNPAGTVAPYVRAIRSVTAVGPHRVRLVTATPYPLLIADLTRVRIIPALLGDDVTTERFNRGEAAIGTGPYRAVRWTPGDRLELQRNPGHYGPAPVWENVVFRPITSDTSRLAALLSGGADVIDKVSTADVARMRTDDRVVLFPHDGNRTMFLVPDLSRDVSPFVTARDGTPLDPNPLRKTEVRRALSLAINRTALAERTMEGLASPANQAAPQGMFGYSDRIPPATFDAVGARRLLAEAGYPNGFRLTLHCSSGRYVNDRQTCQAVGQMLSRIGIETVVEAEPPSVFYTRMTRFDASLLLNGWGSIGDNLTVMRQALHSVDESRGYGGFNRGRYANAEVDRLIEAAAGTIDTTRRAAAQQAAMEQAMADLGVIPLYTASWAWATRRGLAYEAGFDEGTMATRVTRQ